MAGDKTKMGLFPSDGFLLTLLETVSNRKEMNVDTDSTLVVSLFVGGMSLPVLGSVLVHDVLSLYLSGPQFIYSVAFGFGLLALVVLAIVDVDRLDFFSVCLIFPWIFVLGMAILVISTEGAPGLTYLFDDIGDLGAYAGSFMIAGIASMLIRERIDRVSRRYRSVPPSRSIALGVAILVVIAILAGGGLLTVSAMSASVSDVEPGVVDHYTPVLNVTLEGNPTELRLIVTGPEGSTHMRRITRSAMHGEPVTVPVEFYRIDGYPKAGTYHVEVSAISGIPVDTATYTVDEGPSPSLLSVETAGPNEPLALGLPPNATVYRPSLGPTDPDTRIAVVIKNEGDVAGEFDTRLHVAEDRVVSRDIFIEPGQQGGNILVVPVEDVERIRERANGTVTVEVVYDDERITEDVQLPES